ncbi:4'-phosphopantetheinyl transferase [Thermosulfidibacter takaii ABI70S6]|uniref:Enterobactin synthase component D n=1 Tax=Thermosulfidibacter takaii (strain DSM 17441 / JCM 13301 / NBRC 103674 / ABI70S6) TaxID=1298851 RepID=A0A0S3QT87_THET7|nr:4'-phosphopantetheinyl transferase superfamily protein [Thermosulfidibacter takaii]BAT71535.1 4'-phosphopantetheinyl transferase [Thermosulfidibacter takaii ABI70S6]
MTPVEEVELFFEKKIPTLRCAFLNRTKNLKDHTAGRLAAKRALAKCGVDSEVSKGKYGEPVWPEGIVGSISHSRQHAFSVVGKREDFCSLGCDVELYSRMCEKVATRIMTPEESKVSLLQDQIYWTILFSAKEAFYKMQFPIFGKRLSFKDVTVLIEDERLKVYSFIEAEGVFLVGEGYVAVTLYLDC